MNATEADKPSTRTPTVIGIDPVGVSWIDDSLTCEASPATPARTTRAITVLAAVPMTATPPGPNGTRRPPQIPIHAAANGARITNAARGVMAGPWRLRAHWRGGGYARAARATNRRQSWTGSETPAGRLPTQLRPQPRRSRSRTTP